MAEPPAEKVALVAQAYILIPLLTKLVNRCEEEMQHYL